MKMDRKDQYKTSGHNLTAQRSKRRGQEAEIRKEKREKLLSSKRIRLSEIENDCEVEDYTVEQVQELAKTIQKSDKNILNSLKSLRKAFAQGSELISVFVAADNSLRALVGYLTGNNAQLQLEAAWCITNLATGVHDDTMKVLKASAAYLITYLSGQNVQLQDQCAWALGNFSGDSQECRDILRAQGIIVPMVNLLKVLISIVYLSAVVGGTYALIHVHYDLVASRVATYSCICWSSVCHDLNAFPGLFHLLPFFLHHPPQHDLWAAPPFVVSFCIVRDAMPTPGQTRVILMCSHSSSLHPPREGVTL